MKMKKNTYLIVIVAFLALAGAFLLLNPRSGTLSRNESDFSIRDTSSVQRIFLADRSGNQIDLQRQGSRWMINGEFEARREALEQFLSTMMRLTVRGPVARSAHNSVISRLASTGVKVEIYQRTYLIDLGEKLRLFPRIRATRVFYVGDNTQDNLGTFMAMEGAERPYIVYLPGFRGFVSIRFSPRLSDWRDHSIFRTRLADIASVQVEVSGEPENSYTITHLPNGTYRLEPALGEELQHLDTLKVLSFLTAFDDLRFESLLNGTLPQAFIDSVAQSPVHQRITLIDTQGRMAIAQTHRRKLKEPEFSAEGMPVLYDRDRMYAFINEGKDFVLVQFFVFDRITRPLSWFSPDESYLQ